MKVNTFVMNVDIIDINVLKARSTMNIQISSYFLFLINFETQGEIMPDWENLWPTVVKGEFQIQTQWNDKLLDPSTEEFKSLKCLTRNALEKVIRSDEKIFEHIEIIFIDVHFR